MSKCEPFNFLCYTFLRKSEEVIYMKQEKHRWRWTEGKVNTAEEHIQLRYRNARDSDWKQWPIIALLSPPKEKQFTVQFLLTGKGLKEQKMIREVRRELDDYLVKKKEENPWAYARYHCGTGANLYSKVHWVFFPRCWKDSQQIWGGEIMKLKVPKYYQGKNDNACGPTCIRMVIDYYLKKKGKKLSKAECENILQETMQGNRDRSLGTVKKDLKAVFRKRGFICKELFGSRKETKLANLFTAINAGKPVILGCMAKIKYYGRYSHYIVLTGIDESYLYVNDPYPGRLAKIAIVSFLRNGQPTSWGNARWGIIIG
jgi:predicted double-glycine peptidase